MFLDISLFRNEMEFSMSSKKNYATKRGFEFKNFKIRIVDILIVIALLVLLVIIFR